MEIRELEWFIILAEYESVTQAAETLHISQPTMSRALSRLERRVGTKLFDRHHNKLILNRYGELFLGHATRALNELRVGRENILNLVDPEQGTVSLGYIPSFGTWLVPALLDLYHSLAPSTRFELIGGNSASIIQGVKEGKVDIGFVGPQPTTDDVQWHNLGRQELCFEVPPGHELEGRSSITVTECAEYPMLMLGTNSGLRKTIDDLFARADVKPEILIEPAELSSLRAMIYGGGGPAIIPVPPGEQYKTSRTIPIEGSRAYSDFGVVTAKEAPASGAAKLFMRFTVESWDDIDKTDFSVPFGI